MQITRLIIAATIREPGLPSEGIRIYEAAMIPKAAPSEFVKYSNENEIRPPSV
jgi:hypothetical protein